MLAKQHVQLKDSCKIMQEEILVINNFPAEEKGLKILLYTSWMHLYAG